MDFLKSKKVKGFILGIVALFLSDVMGLDEHTVNGIIAAIISYLGSQGIADFGKANAEVTTKAKKK